MYNLHKHLIALLSIIMIVSSCKHDPIDGSANADYQLKKNIQAVSPDGAESYYILPEQTDLSAIPQDPKNPLSWEKVELGKMLFFETGIALDANHPSAIGTYSCGSCHVPSAGFLPGSLQGFADGGIGFGVNGEARTISPVYKEEEVDVQGNRPLSVLNVAYVSNTSWNGQFGGNDENEGTASIWNDKESTEVNHLGYHGLESQNIEGMKVHRMMMNETIADTLGYKLYYDRAFPNRNTDERYNIETSALAISAYLRTLLTNDAPFQQWLKGDKNAMTEEQKQGAMLFFGEAQCFYCHNSPALQSNEFHALGVNGIYQSPESIGTSKSDNRNLGRGGFTQNVQDYYKFQVPQLYNLKNAGFYFHGSSKRSIKEVIEYKSKAEHENPDVPRSQISDRFQAVNLSEKEIENLTDFIEHGLYDEKIERYVPDFVLSGNCYPNNDPMSKVHLGCN